MSGLISESDRQSIAAARAAIERGEFAAARDLLGDIEGAEASYLLGIAHQYTGQLDDAEAAYRQAIAQQPTLTHAGAALGRLLIGLERFHEAAPVYEQLLRISPGNLSARYDQATVQLGLGQSEAAAATFDALIREGNDRPEIRFMHGRALLELGRVEDAIDELRVAHVSQPAPYSLGALASALWMTGEHEKFANLLTRSLQNPALLAKAADLMRQSKQPERAVDILEAARASQTLDVDGYAVLTQAHLDVGNAEGAASAARAGLAAEPGNRSLTASLASALLMLGQAQETLDIVMPMRIAEANGQHWIAYEATALRMLDDPRYEALVDMERFVRRYELPLPEGFDSLAEFNAAFLAALDRWRNYDVEPLDQTLRSGSQTTRDLTSIDDPVISAYIRALDGPIRDYMRAVGNDPDHPLTLRNTGEYRIAGSWSVRLHGGGKHINHVHPEGWISSAYYVEVPADVDDEDGKAGWIKFGEPPFETEPATPPQKWVKPDAGVLVLFPSFLWHGTAPIYDGSTRVTAPFDVVPI